MEQGPLCAASPRWPILSNRMTNCQTKNNVLFLQSICVGCEEAQCVDCKSVHIKVSLFLSLSVFNNSLAVLGKVTLKSNVLQYCITLKKYMCVIFLSPWLSLLIFAF